ncbi:TetR/AcrR family transcriptional regulator [Saccharibacillus endophyticus]|uniref:TetR family transcriptional regulator n=1 Tax=Saccharibacillus endophyticus TaxID=2060666 RepID=A0ABQ1ZV51_9BACL|nr:TetR/AcrR family transcriptional regulator [Saccharibacillus endophyticus]GGH77426.1 TetR family transcriptional regulator [Saccharibacillus endophyticus]
MARHKEFEISEVLDQAIHLFWEQGYEKTSMQELVEHMGIHRRSIYDTFGDKHALFMEALKRYSDIQNKKLVALVAKKEAVYPSLQRFLEITLEKENEPQGCFMVNSGVELGVLDSEVASFIEKAYDQTEELLYELIVHGQQKGEVSKSLDARELSYHFMNAWLGLRTMAKTATNKDKISSIIRNALRVLE